LRYMNLNQKPIKEYHKSSSFLVDCLFDIERGASKVKVRDPSDEVVDFLKQVLERNAPLLPYYEQEIFGPLGVTRDRKIITKPDQHKIAIQIIAQILWKLEKCSSIQDVISYAQSEKDPVSQCFGFSQFRAATLRNWLSPIYPVPLTTRRKPNVRKLVFMMKEQPISEVFSEHGVNFQKLRFALQVMTQTLQFLDWSFSEIVNSQFVESLKQSISEDLHLFIRQWIEEAYSNSCIFDQ